MMPTPRDRPGATAMMVSLGPLLARPDRFKHLFADGMRLLEEAAGYLDGPGRDDAKSLSGALADAYSAESMRLTTRLMQVASWLLIRRAVLDGQMTSTDALQDRVKVTLVAQSRAAPMSIFLQLPLPLQRLTEGSLRLQRRVIHLDRMVNDSADRDEPMPSDGLAKQYAMLHSAYGPLR